jgi:orotate phosphoribosyltransferase
MVHNADFVIVDNVLSSSEKIESVMRLIEQSRGHVKYVAVLVDRSNGRVTAKSLGIEALVSMVEVDFETYPEGECPLCNKGTPIWPYHGGQEWCERHSGRTIG